MVDATHKIKPQANQPATSGFLRSRYLLRSSRKASEWEQIGKSTYRLYITLRKKATQQLEDFHLEGTAVHIGEGLFLSALHCFHWMESQGYSSRTHTAGAYLRSGSGDLSKWGRPGPLSISVGSDIECSPIQWPSSILTDTIQKGLPLVDGLLDERYVIPDDTDFILLKARPKRWLARLRRAARPHVLPGSLVAKPASTDITLVGVNSKPSPHEYQKLDGAVNTPREYNAAVDALLPDHISYCSTHEGQQIAVGPMGRLTSFAGSNMPAQVLRYPLSSLQGSSGSGIYDTNTKRLVGLHSRSEIDTPTRGIGVTAWGESNLARGPCLDGDKFRLFTTVAIVPELRRIGE